MKVWTCNTFWGHWPVGTAAVVIAETEADARALLDAEIRRGGLRGLRADDVLVPLSSGARVLRDGDY